MATALEIANRALSRLGAQRLESMIEDSRNGSAVQLHYVPTVRETLRSVPWTCARTRATLVAADPQPDDTDVYLAAWDLPDDLLMALDLASGDEFILEGETLLTDDLAPVLLYTRLADESAWDDLLCSAVELRLASKLAFELTGKADLGNALLREAAMALSDARRASLRESRSGSAGAVLWTEAP